MSDLRESPAPMLNVQIDGVWHQFPKDRGVIEGSLLQNRSKIIPTRSHAHAPALI